VALSTTRDGGVSEAPYANFNLGDHVGDDAEAVRGNRDRLAQWLPPGAAITWLEQVHGVDVVEAGDAASPPRADAAWTDTPGRVCAVLTADCLPVLFTTRQGSRVAAAHAGWRGLAGGVLEATVRALGAPPADLMAWLGPAIGPGAFEVGPEVREAFLAGPGEPEGCFVPGGARPGHFLADLYGLARARLGALGLEAVYGGGYCTLAEEGRFFSYRRDGPTGRMATCIALSQHR